MEFEAKIRYSELIKVPIYIERLENIYKSEGIVSRQALVKWADEITTRRLAWFENNKDCLNNLEGTEVRKGYELIFLQMGVPLSEVPIIEETATKITWHAKDFCPYLEAINELGMDTRIICKLVTEPPVQAILDMFNPDLRFSRDYQNIRPHSPFCVETIKLVARNILIK